MTATINARHTGLALFSFLNDYGSFPNASTAVDVTKHNPTHSLNLSGNSSNAAFRQLFAAGFTDSEEIFYARIPAITKPDGDFTPGNCLSKGENAFAYISGLSSSSGGSTPILLCPLIPGTTKFDPEPFDGKAVILCVDQSVRKWDIHKDGHIYDKGVNLLSAKHPFWKGKAPDICYPE
ncbi:MAG: hypothetical protein ACSHX9_06825 [Luteolibacter sp.]